MRKTRNDVRYLISAILLMAAVTTVTTGLIADVWDLNDFIFHKYAGYTLAVLLTAHVYLHWSRLAGYIRRRFTRPPSRRAKESDPQQGPSATTDPVASPGAGRRTASRSPFSRRGFFGVALGGLGGFFVGRGFKTVALPYGSDVGEIYHEWSKPKWLSLLGAVTSWGQEPDRYKVYAGVERVELPPPGDFRGLSTEDAIEQRRSLRDYTGEPMTLDELSRLLYYTGGVNAERWGRPLRAAPSAGALYPIEMYVVVHQVEGVERGLYHYAVREHALDHLRDGDLRGEIVRNGLMQGFLGEANVVIVFTAIFQRLRWRYKERTYRYALLEAGHLAQNVYLAATSMGMGACAVGAFLDSRLNSMLEVDGKKEAALYLLSVGRV